ncbi:DUF6207 family protein [Streptomyces olivochromogenes]|uniref:DUF6207 family protein n=1 Tax=Streptomyces olivochromogenes TaxID=1963 RepID=UPI0027E5968C|nr:DUF6207 family protein [Streptomyces olivochromogenes]
MKTHCGGTLGDTRRSAVHERSARKPAGLVDVVAADDATALAFQQLLADRWATASSGAQ